MTMQFTPDDRDRMNRAIGEISETIGKTMHQLRPRLQSKFGLTHQLLNVAVARAGLTIAAAACAGALDLGPEGSADIFEELDDVLLKRLD